MDKSWVDYVRKDQTKSMVMAVHPVYPQYVTCLLQQSLRHNSAALCCVACAVREDLHMGKWNKLLLNLIADFAKNFYKRSVKMLRLKSNHYLSLEQLVSSFFMGDWKYTIKLEEALRGKMDMEDQCAKDTFDCSINALLKTGDAFILSCDEHNWAIWMGDNINRPNLGNITYMFDPHRYVKDDPSDRYTKPKIHPTIIRFIHHQYMMHDLIECMNSVGTRQKSYILTKFTLESKHLLTRNPSEKFEVYMSKHCPNAIGTFEKFFGARKRKETLPGVVAPEDIEEKSIADSVLERGSGFFLNPHTRYSCCPEKQFCKKICTICKTDFKKLIFLESGLLDCKTNKIDRKELDHNHYVRHPSGKECWVLEANHGLVSSYRECAGNQGITVAIMALKRIDRKKARSWDKSEVDDIVKIGTVMFKEFCRHSCQFQRPTLLGLSRCLGSSESWGGWQAKTVAWGTKLGLSSLITGLVADNGRGLLQLPGSLDVAIWKDRDHYYLFLPEDKNDEEVPARVWFFHTISDMSVFLSDMISSTADICVSRIDFNKETANQDVDGDKPESFKCMCITKADVVEHRYGLPASVALLTIITANEISSETWEKRHIEEIIDRAMSYLDETINEEKRSKSKEITIQDFPKLFLLEDFGIVETEIFYNVIRGSLQYTTEKSNKLNLKDGFKEFFKEYSFGVLCCRGLTMPVWKSPDGNFFYIKYLAKKTESGDGLEFCMLRLACEDLLAQYIESDFPPSRDDRFYINGIMITIMKMDPVSGSVRLQLKGGYNWLVENKIAILRSWECPKLISDCTLPAALLFGCACTLLPPNKFTGHHLSSFVECSHDVGKRLKKQYRLLNTGILDNMTNENIKFGMHSFQITFGPKLTYFFDKNNRVDYSLPVARNISPTKYDANAVGQYFEKAFSVPNCHQLIVRIDDYLVVCLWKLWPDGPVVLFQPQSFFPIPPILDIWRLDETVANKVQPPVKGKKGKGKKGKKNKSKGKKGKKKGGVKEGPRPAVSIYLYPSLKQLARHIGTVLPFGFSEGRLVTYPVNIRILSEVITTTVNPDAVTVKDESFHPVPKIGHNFSMMTEDMWYLFGTSIFECSFQGIQKRDMEFSTSVMGTVVDSIESVIHWNPELLDMIMKFGHQLFTTKIPGACGKRAPFTVPNNFFVSDFKVNITITHNTIVGDMMAPDDSHEVYNLVSGLNFFFGNEDKSYGILMARNYTVAVWKMNFQDFKRYRKAREEYDYFRNEELKNRANLSVNESKMSQLMKESSRMPAFLSKTLLTPDDFDIAPGETVLVDVVKTGEVKLPKDKKDKKGKKGKKEVDIEPPLALLPEPPAGAGIATEQVESVRSESFKTMSTKDESVYEGEVPQTAVVDVDVPTEVEKHVENVEEDEPEEPVHLAEGEDLPVIEELAESLHDLDGSDEEEESEESYISPVLSYTTEEEISDSGSSVPSTAFSETFYPDDCVVFIWDPSGQCSPKLYGESGKPVIVSFRNTKDLSAFFLEHALQTGLGSNRFTLHTVNIEWRHKTCEERAASPKCPPKPRGFKDCRVGEEAATAYVHPGGGRTYLIANDRRSRKSALRNSICWCVAALVMHHLLDINLWSTLTFDDIDAISTELRVATEKKIANNFEKKDIIIMPEDVVKDFMLSKRQIHVDIEEIFDIQVEGNGQHMDKLKFALDLFFKGKDPLGYLYTEDRPCCAMWKSKEPNKLFIATNWPKNHIVMYDNIENFITGYLTQMRELKQCILNIKLFKIFVTSRTKP